VLEKRRYQEIDNVYFGEVEFLPEPLAVFNYYRYGFRHPELSGKEKYCVLVLDIGGGTSDCSVVETTKEGEVSQSSKMSKPFGASSDAVGGYFVNHHLAASAMIQRASSGSARRSIKRSFTRCLSVMQGREQHSGLHYGDIVFYDNYQWVVYYVEAAKRRLVAAIASDPRGWMNEEPPAAEEWIDLPDDPYSVDSTWSPCPLTTSLFREVVLKEVWLPHLKPLIGRTIENAEPSLEGKSINRVILSGGTANIGWIGEWLRTDIPELKKALLVDIKEDYQEVVAKGLAIECARRFFSSEHTSDFDMVTYNPLSVAMGLGRTPVKLFKMKPMGGAPLKQLPDQPGALIEAATDMRMLEGKRLEWKVAGETEKPKHIEYYFHAAPPTTVEGDPTRAESRLNFEQSKIDASSKAGFDQHLKLELDIRADGTVTPTFVFREGKHATPADRAKGQSFYMDMTSSGTETKTATKAYLGLDFGSSNTALAYVSAASISQYHRDSQDPSWLELSELEQHLPTPMAVLFALYIAESGDPLRRAKRARQAIETGLSLSLAILWADEEKRSRTTSHAGRHGPIKSFKYTKVSAGPIWARVQDYVNALSENGSFSKPLNPMTVGSVFETIDGAVTDVGKIKHDKIDELSVDWNRPLLLLGNLARQVFEKVDFGFFFESRLRAGKVHAKFRRLHGQGVGSAPIAVVLNETPEDGQVYVLHAEANLAIPLFPWILLSDAEDSDRRKFLFFDGPEGKDAASFSYRCPDEPETLTLQCGQTEGLAIYADMAAKLIDGMFPSSFVQILEFSE